MGIGRSFGEAYLKAQLAALNHLPKKGAVLFTIADHEKAQSLEIARKILELGFELWATTGTAEYLSKEGLKAKRVRKISEGSTEIIDGIVCGEIGLVINTRSGRKGKGDARRIDIASVNHQVPVYTTIRAAKALSIALEIYLRNEELFIEKLQKMRK